MTNDYIYMIGNEISQEQRASDREKVRALFKFPEHSLKIFDTICEKPQFDVASLVKKTGFPRQNVTSTVHKLEQAGIIKQINEGKQWGCQYLYEPLVGTVLVKVGVSKNPQKRVKQLQTGNSDSLHLLFTEEFECSRKNLLKIEHMVHTSLSHICHKKTGEWFEIDKNNAEQVKNTIIWHRIRYDN
jgi:predicted transcriptional regulator